MLTCFTAALRRPSCKTPNPKPRAYADSKTLSEAERSRLFKALAADPSCVYVADLLSAQFISGQMLGRARVSLNAVAEQSTMGLIQDVLDAGVQLKEVCVYESLASGLCSTCWHMMQPAAGLR